MLYYTYIVHVYVHIYAYTDVEYPISCPGGDAVDYMAFNVQNL